MIKKTTNFLQEFSIPLILGVVIALIWANFDYKAYHHFIDYPLLGDIKWFGYSVTLHFLINDIFMVFFFGIAAVEIVQSVLPGGSLNPMRKAVNPLLGTLGGIVGPVGVFFLLCAMVPMDNLFSDEISMQNILRGWGIPTATDIALAWLIARFIFGKHHPAISYLLLLAIVDDAIGLAIIAIFYPDPMHAVNPTYLLLIVVGMLIAFGMRKMKLKNMLWYVLISGTLCWLGLIKAHLHPALALVFVVPFMPASEKKIKHAELFEDEKEEHSTLTSFEHIFKLPVDLGLLGFGLANAGVVFSSLNQITWIILASLLIGKTVGITGLAMLGQWCKMDLPKGINFYTLIIIGIIASIGLTVALFISQEAYLNPDLQNAAKMGALFSSGAALLAFVMIKIFPAAAKDKPHKKKKK